MSKDDRKRLLNFHDDEEMKSKAEMTSSPTNNNEPKSISCSCKNPIK